MTYRSSLLLVALLLVSGSAFTQDRKPIPAADMQTLLAKGLLVNSSDLEGGKHFTGRVNLAAGGKLSGTLTPKGSDAIPLSGTWRLKGGQLCRTLAPIEPAEVCETWLRTGPREAIIQVGGKQTSINRW